MSLVFTIERKTREMGICLWDGSQLVDVCIMRCGKDMPLVKDQLGMVSKLLGATFEEPDIVSCGCVGVDVSKTLEKMLSSKVGLHYPFSIHALQIEKPLRKPSYSAMGRIDLLAVQKLLLLPLSVCWDFNWMLSTQFFCKVCQIFVAK